VLVHLRHKRSKLYYAGGGRWVPGPSPTLRFHTISDALLYSRQEGLQDTEVVLLHSDSLHKLVLPAGARLRSEPEHSGYQLRKAA
jgi:hypothetical protein